MNCTTTRVLVVDDSALYRQSLQNVLRDVPGISVVGSAKNGVEALEKTKELSPDLVTLDVQMPDMDGIEVLRELGRRKLSPTVIMVSSLTAEGAQVTTDALMEGAFDFILKPSGSDPLANRQLLRDSLANKIAAFQESASKRLRSRLAQTFLSPSSSSDSDTGANRIAPSTSRCRLVVIGTSTGGPQALKTVLPKITAQLPVPVLVVQHMPAGYTSTLAKRLNALCPLEVSEARNGMPLEGGRILLAPGGQQMRLQLESSQPTIQITDDKFVHGVRPSLDYLIESLGRGLQADTLAVILTGMGRDGLEGCRSLKQAGGYVFAQDQSDCVVYGMPKAVIEAELADRVLPLGKIAPAVFRHIKRGQRQANGGSK